LAAEPAVAVAQATEAYGRIAPGLAHFSLGDFASVAGLLLALAQPDAVEGAEAGLAALQVAALLVGQRLAAIAGQVRLAAGGLGIAEADVHRAPVFEYAHALAAMADDGLERIVVVSAASRVIDHGMVSFQNRAATTKRSP
jgi:hypothetical protein